MPVSASRPLHIHGCPPVKLERRAGQRNLRIRVKPDLVVVSGPRYCTNQELISFLNDRLDWVRKTTQKLQHSRSSIDKLLHEFRGHVYLRGAWLPLVLRHARPGSDTWLLSDRQTRVDVYPPEGCTEAGFEPSHVVYPPHSSNAPSEDNATAGAEAPPEAGSKLNTVVYPPHSSNAPSEDNATAGAEAPPEAGTSKLKILTERRTLIEVPVDELLNFQRELAKKQLTNEFKELSATLPFQWNRLFIRSQKTKWGTCSSKGNISLNWRLIKCPEHIRRYIMIHELCHTVHLNHSRAFWTLVRHHYPDVKQAHDWLKTHGELVFT
jgi:predicted metal-dependent hydrolase